MKKIIELLDTHEAPPVTRREFLARATTGFGAVAVAPTVLGTLLLGSEAQAKIRSRLFQQPTADASLLPFLVFDLAGGAALPGNFLVGKEGGPEDLLSSYDTLGWNPRDAGAIDKRFGLPMSAKLSGIFKGITQTASADAQKGLKFASICNFSQDDSSSNRLSAITLVNATGITGSAIPNATAYDSDRSGFSTSTSGGKSAAAYDTLAPKPVPITSLDDLLASVRYQDALGQLKSGILERMAKAASKLSKEQAQKLNQMSNAKQLETLHGGFFDVTAMGGGANGLDPREDDVTRRIYNISSNSGSTDQQAIFAGVVRAALTGASGPGVLTIGGCDYHTGSSQAGDAKDLEVGQHIGRAVELAFQLKKPFFFQILTDGGVTAKGGTRDWSGDFGLHGLGIMGVYDPNGKVTQRRQQIGSYAEGQGVNLKTLVGQDTTKVAGVVLANYLSVSGKLGNFQTLAPGDLLDRSQLDSVICFDRA